MKQILTMIVLCIGITGFSQSLTPGIISSAGSSTTQMTMNVGEIIIVSDQLTQGVGQNVTLTVVGVEDSNVDFTVIVYPNPTSESIQIKTDLTGNMEINIVDLTGKIVYTGTMQFTTTVDVSGLPNGIYVLNVVNNHDVMSYKIMKK